MLFESLRQTRGRANPSHKRAMTCATPPVLPSVVYLNKISALARAQGARRDKGMELGSRHPFSTCFSPRPLSRRSVDFCLRTQCQDEHTSTHTLRVYAGNVITPHMSFLRPTAGPLLTCCYLECNGGCSVTTSLPRAPLQRNPFIVVYLTHCAA